MFVIVDMILGERAKMTSSDYVSMCVCLFAQKQFAQFLIILKITSVTSRLIWRHFHSSPIIIITQNRRKIVKHKNKTKSCERILIKLDSNSAEQSPSINFDSSFTLVLIKSMREREREREKEKEIQLKMHFQKWGKFNVLTTTLSDCSFPSLKQLENEKFKLN